MASANGDALEWALALAKAPSERLLLRQRALPEGIERVLQIAAGHSDSLLEEAAARTGESRASVLDAVRFYLREVLFHPEADAYRVLGLSRNADPAQIKLHHRLLQHWLHPDRQTSEWDAAFAARVNAAWHQLRDAGRRRAYDVAHPAADEALPAVAFAPVATGWTHALPDEPLPPSERWRQRLPLLGLLLACVALGLLALRDIQQDAPGAVLSLPSSVEGSGVTVEGEAVLLDLRNAVASAPPHVRDGRRPPGQGPSAASAESLGGRPAHAAIPEAVARSDSRERDRIPDVAISLPPAAQAPMPVVVRDTLPVPVPAVAPTRAPVRATPSASSALAGSNSVLAPRGPRVYMPVPVEGSPTAVQVQLAQQVGDRLLVYMGRETRTVPPIWDSLTAQQGASQLRDLLVSGGDVRFGVPDWRVDGSRAAMKTAIRQADGTEGRLAAELIWREQRWLVRNLSMERDL